MKAYERRALQGELVQDVDDSAIVKQGVPCPVEWCNAHVLRHGLCGDAAGDFEGVHRGRLNRAKHGRWKTVSSRKFEKLGLYTSSTLLHIDQTIEDGRNMGMIPGQTDAQRRQARARRNW